MTRVPSVVILIIIIIIIFPCDLALWVGWWVVVVCGGEGDTASSEWACSSICVPLCTGMLPSSKSSIIIMIMMISVAFWLKLERIPLSKAHERIPDQAPY